MKQNDRKKSLEEICIDKGINIEQHFLMKRKYNSLSEQDIKLALEDLFMNFYDSLILIGGLSARKDFLGYKNLRKLSNDINLVISKPKKIDEIKSKYGLTFIKDYNAIFSEVKDVPAVYHVRRVHNLEINEDFIRNIKPVKFNNIAVRVSSPEYIIFMKLLRTEEKDRFFGKDKLDIASVLLAYYNKKIDFDEDFFVYLLNSSPYTYQLKEYFTHILYIKNLNKQDKHSLYEIVDKITKKF